MAAVITNALRVNNAQDFADRFSSENYYAVIGRVRPWTATPEDGSADDNNPPDPLDTRDYNNQFWHEAIAAKEITDVDVVTSIPRVDWTSGTVYTQYNSNDDALTEKPFYVLTDEYNVYKCIDNNGGAASTVKPTGTGTSLITTGDNYVWKFMYTINTSDTQTFLTSQHMPVRYKTSNDGSDQYQVQQNATPGEIYTIEVTNGGSGYTSATVSIDGDGTGATADANINGGVIESIDVTAYGQDYTTATVSISGDGSGAEARANLAPQGGHGANALRELGGYYTTIAVEFEFDESGTFTTENDYRTVGIVRDPYAYGTTNLFTNFVARLTWEIDVSGVSGTFQRDEKVVGGTSGADGYVVEYDSANNKLYLNSVFGTFSGSETITGQSTGATATVDTVTDPDIEPLSGLLLFKEHRRPITRNADQQERIFITLEW